MRRGMRRNRAFDIMTDRFGSLIDPSHFGGKSSFSIKRKKADRKEAIKTRNGQMTVMNDPEKPAADKQRVSVPAWK
jgi:hypothetical protein